MSSAPDIVKLNAWRAANPERIKAQQRAAYLRRRDERLASAKMRAEAKREPIAAYKRAHYQRNMAKIKAAALAWSKANPEARRAVTQRRRAQMLGAEGAVTAQDIREISAAQRDRCAHCSEKRKLTVDHINPLSRGGSHTRRNIQMLCKPCNSSKNALDPLVFARREGLLL